VPSSTFHGSTDPWLFGYYVVIGVSTGLMAIISGGVEAPVAFHTANNLLLTTVNSLMAGGGTFALDRSVGSGDASLLILAAVNVGMVVLVWMRERRARITSWRDQRGLPEQVLVESAPPGGGRPVEHLHLVRLLRIKRLVDLGFSLPQIADLGELDDHPAEALHTLDAELAATIDRLQRARAELGDITDLPPELAPVAHVDLSEADRSFVAVLGRIVGPERREAWADMLQDLPTTPSAPSSTTSPTTPTSPPARPWPSGWSPTSTRCAPGTRTSTSPTPRCRSSR
jgi:DNA-binding transcriptional MerR regulator